MAGGPLSPEFWGLNPDWSSGTPGDGGAVRPFGSTYVPTNRDVSRLRQQQQAFSNEVDRLDAENRWMAIPALAPVAAVAAAEGAAALAARFAKPIPPGPLVFSRRDFPTGNHYAAKFGKEVHKAFKAHVESKLGWKGEQKVYNEDGSRYVIPDATGPVRNAVREGARYQLELKPDSPKGHQRARAAIKRYEAITNNKTRAVFYDPKTGQWRD
jgi:hypothetical protein